MKFCSKSFGAGLISVAMSLGLWSGCSDSDAWKAKTQPMHGKVVINGEPAAGVIVTFHIKEGDFDVRKSKPFGVVGADGMYEVRTYRKGDGLPPGEYAVTMVMRKDPGVQDFTDLLNGAFDELSESQWSFKVDPGQAEIPLIELTGVKVVSANQGRGRPAPAPVQGVSE